MCEQTTRIRALGQNAMAQAGPRFELGFYHHSGEAGARSPMHL